MIGGSDLSWLVPLPVVIPLTGAGLALALLHRPRAQRAISLVALGLVLAASAALLVAADSGALVVDIGGWAAPVGIDLVADRLSALMLTVSSAVTLGVLVYSIAQGAGDDAGPWAPVAIYHPTYLVLSAGVANAFLSGDLFNLYVGFEVLLAASYVLLTLEGSPERVRAGTVYVVVALLSSVLFLISIALIYAATGTVNLAQLAQRLPDVDPGVRLALELSLLVAFGVKAAVFPLFAWLPDSYPTAPAPVTAVFAGLLTKVGVYAIIRTRTLLFPDDRLDTLLLWVALLTMLVGILGAVAQNDVKRVLSFTLVSHIGYMIFGIALAERAGLSAAIFYVVHHITVQTSLFLVVGLIERRGGSTRLDELGGLAAVAPLLAVLFLLPALNLAGIPPFSGFLGKLGLIQAGLDDGSWLAVVLVVGSLVTSLLTLYALTRVWNRAFWHEAPASLETVAQPVPRGMMESTAVLVGLGLAFTVAAGPLWAYTDRAAVEVLRPQIYISGVLPDGERGSGVSDDAPDEQSAGDEQPGAEQPEAEQPEAEQPEGEGTS